MKKVHAVVSIVYMAAATALLAQPVVTPPVFFPPPSNLPTVASVCTTEGSINGGDTVNITGTNFDNATNVSIGSTSAGTIPAATSWWINSPTSITMVTPAANAGTFDVTVTNPSGTSVTNAGDQFTYKNYGNTPVIYALAPNNGVSTGVDYVSIAGTNLSGVTQVHFGGTTLSGGSISVQTPNYIGVRTSAGTAGQTVPITVTDPVNGTSPTTCANQFTFFASAPPTSVATIPATATRPAYNTGAGFFVKGRGIYDPNGNLFTPRGANRLQFDKSQDNRFYSMENAERMEPYMVATSWTTQHGLLDDALNNWVVPIVGVFHNPTFGTSLVTNAATTTGNVLSFANVPPYSSQGVLPGATVSGTNIPASTWVQSVTGTTVTLTSNVTGTGVASGATITFNPTQTAGHSDQAQSLGAAQQWVANCCTGSGNVGAYVTGVYAPLNKTYDNLIIINLINEYGAQPNGTNPTPLTYAGWIITAIQSLRTAGYKAPIMVDASSGGANTDIITAYGPRIIAGDPLHSVFFDVHMYGGWIQVSGTYNGGGGICLPPGCPAWTWPFTSYHWATQTFPIITGEFQCANCSAANGASPVTVVDVITPQVQYQSGYLPWGWDDESTCGTGCLTMLGIVTAAPNCATNVHCYCYFNAAGTRIAFQFGIDAVETPTYGMRAAASPASIFTGTRPPVPVCPG